MKIRYKILLFFLGILIFLFISILIVFYSPYVQTFITQKISNYYSSKLKNKITIESVDFDFFNVFILNNVCVYDQKNDTLLYVKNIRTEIDSLKIFENKIYMSKINLLNPKINIKTDSLNNNNYSFIIDYFSPKDTLVTPKNKSSGIVHCNNFSIKNAAFNYLKSDSKSKINSDSIFNPDNISIKKLNFNVDNIKVGKNISLTLRNLNFSEKCGFEVKNVSLKTAIEQDKITIDNIIGKLKKSYLNVSKVKITGTSSLEKTAFFVDINKSIICSSDLKFFQPNFKNINEFVTFSGTIIKENNNIYTDNLQIATLNNTGIKTKLKISNIDNLDSVSISGNIDFIKTEKRDILSASLRKITGSKLKIPDAISGLQTILINGNIAATKKSLNYNGQIKLNDEIILSKININKNKNIFVDINLSGQNFKFSNILTSKQVKNSNFTAKVSAVLDTLFNIKKYNLKGFFRNININNYTYNNINIASTLKQKVINTNISTDDTCINFSLNSEFDYRKKLPNTFINFDLKFAKLDQLNIDTLRKEPIIKGNFTADFTGNELSNITGHAGITDGVYLTDNDSINLDAFRVVASNNGFSSTYELESEYFDATVSGTVNIESLSLAFNNFITKYIPSYSNKIKQRKNKIDRNSIIFLEANFKNLEKINKYFFPDLHISDSTNLFLSFSSKKSSLDLEINIPEISYYNNKLVNLHINSSVDTFSHKLITDIKCGLEMPESNINIDKIFYRSTLDNNSLLSTLSFENPDNDTIVYGGAIIAKSFFNIVKDKTIIKTKLEPTEITIANIDWKIDSDSLILDNFNFKINEIRFKNKKQELAISGKISTDPEEALNISVSNFNIKKIKNKIGLESINADGLFSGNIEAYNLLKNPAFDVIGRIENFSINKTKFGLVSILIDKIPHKDYFNVDISAMDPNAKNSFSVKGSIEPGKYIGLKLNIQNVFADIFNPFFNNDLIIENGTLNGIISITGDPANYSLNGKLNLNFIKSRIDYLGTSFMFSSSMRVTNNLIYIDSTQVIDQEGRNANFYAVVNHNNFNNITFEDVSFNTDSFQILNTNELTNENYYGKFLTAGNVNITGKPEHLKIKANLKTLPKSELFIRSYNSELSDKNDFMIFKKTDSFDQKNIEQEPEPTNTDIELNLKVTPETKLNIMLNPATDDHIALTGSSDLVIKTDDSGNIDMSGDYIFNSGYYDLKLANLSVISFNIKKGSKINWIGSPGDAIIDITAVYPIKKVKLYNLTLDEYSDNLYVPTDCNIFLTNKITKPKIKFGVNVKDNSSINNILNNLSPNELNKQFLSLLIFNTFRPLPNAISNSAQEEESNIKVNEILAGQIGNLLSKVSDNVSVDIKYNEATKTKESEIEAGVSTSFLNNRVIINGNIAKGEYRNTTSNIVGDFDAEIKIKKNGKLKMKVFNRSNKNLMYETSPYTQGVGFFIRKDFDRLFKRKKKKKVSKK